MEFGALAIGEIADLFARCAIEMKFNESQHFFPSGSTMFSVDLLLIVISGIGTYIVIAKWKALLKADAEFGVVLILAGIWTGAFLYIFDLFTMTILPSTVGMAEAMARMRTLHLGYSWYINSASAVLVLAGLGLTVIRLLRQVEAVEANSRAHEESEELLESVFQNIPVGLLIKGPDNVVERVNKTYLSWYGLKSSDMVGFQPQLARDFRLLADAEVMADQERQVFSRL